MDNVIQGSPEWFEQRLGSVTASRISDVVAKGRSGEAKVRQDYRAQLIAERLTGDTSKSYSSKSIQWGTDHEEQARAGYKIKTNSEVSEISFVKHPSINFAGASPDALVGNEGLAEIKCPDTSTHIKTILTGEISKQYILQMQWQLACTARNWCDFVSFDPRLLGGDAHGCALHIKRVERDEKLIGELENAVRGFLLEVDGQIEELRDRFKLEAVQ